MGKSEADIALESWLFGFRPCSGQGQITLGEDSKNNDKFKARKTLISNICP